MNLPVGLRRWILARCFPAILHSLVLALCLMVILHRLDSRLYFETAVVWTLKAAGGFVVVAADDHA